MTDMTDKTEEIKNRLTEKYSISVKAIAGFENGFPPIAQEDNCILMYGPVVEDEEAFIMREIFGDTAPIISPLDFKEKLNSIEGNVILRINSPGGSVFAGSSIMADITDRQNAGDRVDSIVSGVAASIAANILVTSNSASAYASSTIMIHQATSVGSGTEQDILAAAQALRGIDQQQSALFAEKTGIDENEIYDLLVAETWYTAEQALEISLIDSIIERNQTNEEPAQPEASMVVSPDASIEVEEDNQPEQGSDKRIDLARIRHRRFMNRVSD